MNKKLCQVKNDMIPRIGLGAFIVLGVCCVCGCTPTERSHPHNRIDAVSLQSEQAVRTAYQAFHERTRGVENAFRYYERPNLLLSEARFAEARSAYAEAEATVFAELREILKAAKVVAPALAAKWEMSKHLEEGFALHSNDFPHMVDEAEREHRQQCKRYGLPMTAMCIQVREADLTGDALPEHVVTYVDWPEGHVPNRKAPERPKYRFLRLKIYTAGQDGSLLEKAAFEVGQLHVDKQNLFVSQRWNQEVIKVGETPVLFHRTYNWGGVRLFVYDAPDFRPVGFVGGSNNTPREIFRHNGFSRGGSAQQGGDYKFSDDFRVLKTMRCAYGEHGDSDAMTVLRKYVWNGADYEVALEEAFDNYLGWKNWGETSGWDGQEW